MRPIDWLAVTILLLFAAGLRIIGIGFGQPNPEFFPSYAPYGMVHEHLPLHPDEFYTVALPFEMALRKRLNPEFFNYPAFLINANLVLYHLTGALAGAQLADRDGALLNSYAPFSLYVLSRAYSVFGAMLAVSCAYAMARLLSGRFAAICAGLLVAVSYTLVQHAHYIKPGTLAGGWMMLAAWASLAALLASPRRSRLRFYLFACGAAGLAATTRYNAAAASLIVLSVGVFLLIRVRSRWMFLQIVAGWLLIPLVFLLGSPFTLLDFDHFWRDFSYIVGQYVATGADIHSYFLVDPWTGLGLMLTYVAWFALGIPAIACAILGFISTVWKREAADDRHQGGIRLFVLLIGLMILIYGLVALRTVRPGHSDGLLILIIPFVAVLAGIGADGLAKRIRLPSRLAMPAIALILIIQPLVLSVQVVKMFSQPDTRDVLLAWIHSHIPGGARFFLNGPYNVPLDNELYPNFAHNLSYASALPDGSEYDYLIYSDTKAFDVLRSQSIVGAELAEEERAYLRELDAAFDRVAEIHRPLWTGSEAMMNMAPFWHNPTLIVYCLNRASCENHR